LDYYYTIYVDANDADFNDRQEHIDELPQIEDFVVAILEAGTERPAWARAMHLRDLRPRRID